MSRRLLLLNLILAVVAALVVFDLVRELSPSRRLPAAPAPRAVQSAGSTAAAPPGTGETRPLWNAIATRSLFNPSRTEAPTTPALAAAAPPKLFLHGVVLDDGRSRAFLEDAASKKVFGYAIGDQIAGGRIETINADRVVIARPEGKVEVMLRDPSKPQPPALAPAAAGAAPAAPGAPAAAAGAQPGPVRQSPFLGLTPPAGTPPIAPPATGQAVTPNPAPPGSQRLFQGASPDFFRRPPYPGNPEVNRPNQGG